MTKLSRMKTDRVHSREIKVETYACGEEDKVVVEGALFDERPYPTTTMTGKRLEPGPVHELLVRFLVGDAPPRILAVEHELPRVPLDECETAAGAIESLAGLPIAYGYSREVKERLGGPRSCLHLTGLVLAMGTAALQGLAAARGRHGSIPTEAAWMLVDYVKDSCYVWRAEGERYREVKEELREAIEKAKE